MENKLLAELKYLSANIHQEVVQLCEEHPKLCNEINYFLIKEMIINNLLYSTCEQAAFRNLLEAQRVAQQEYNELKSIQQAK